MTSKALMYKKSIHRTNLDGPLQGSKRMKLPFRPTPEKPMIVSVSELGSFLRCRLQWNWSYRVGLKTKAEAMPRTNGILVHAGKEGFYGLPRKKRTPQAMQKMAKKAIDEMKEVKVDTKARDLATAMLVGYAEWVTSDHDKSDRAIGKNTIKAEFPFCLPLVEDGSVMLRGYVDEVFEPTIYKGVLAMDETKTKNQIDFDMLDLNNQMSAYLWALQEKWPGYKRYLGWRTVLRRQMPGPRVKAALFGREFVERNPEEIRMWLLDTRRTVKDMLDAAIYPHKTDRCRWECDLYKLCLVRSDKGLLQEIIESEFTAT